MAEENAERGRKRQESGFMGRLSYPLAASPFSMQMLTFLQGVVWVTGGCVYGMIDGTSAIQINAIKSVPMD